MDFVKVLSVAEKNSNIKQNVNYYPTKFTPPKKESKDGRLSEGIKKFLARKEEEEKQKALEEKRKKQNLMSLRDHKAQSKINKHLKVCKSANKSVLADAINTEDTAITMAGPSQPDEDDYGYVSQEASAFYNRLMNKYKNLPPEKPLFSDSGKRVVKDIASTKDRVKQALKQQEIEESLPHRRKRKSTSTTTSTTTTGKEDNNREINEKETKSNEKEEKPKPKKRLPPPMDFVTLLKIAEKKQHEPIIIETKPKPEEKERLMTKKELIEHQKEKDKSEKREQRERDRNSDYAKSLNSSSVCNGSSKLAKALTGKLTKPSSITSKTVNSPVDKKLPKPINQVPKRNGEKLPDKSIKFDEKEAILLERKKVEAERRQLEAMKREIEEEKRKLEMIKRKKNDESRSSSSSSSLLGKKIVKSNERIDKSANFNGKTNVKPRQFPPADVRPRQFPPADLKSRPLKSMKNGKPGNKKRIYDDSDEEYDSELDDFIDDGPQEQSEDYSKHISEIFGYDKSKYRNFDDDDDNMESNYAQQLREEFVSTKLGIMEDLEDIRIEALEKKRKTQTKKKIKK